MTKEQFLDRLQARDRDYVMRGWIALMLLVMAVVLMFVAVRFGTHALATKVLSGLVAMSLVTGTSILLFWDLSRGVRCTSCRRRLFKTAAQITLATGNCAYCGDRVLEPTMEEGKS
ncbi:MAG TPA: hypothetical protein VFB72_17350 [Verrucomicrobiae bacterium]|nr:hypothetical protein [Verrucomicrobiae bacterium]